MRFRVSCPLPPLKVASWVGCRLKLFLGFPLPIPNLRQVLAIFVDVMHLPDLKVRAVNVVDPMKLQPQTEHPHGLNDMDFDQLFTKDRPVIFSFHDPESHSSSRRGSQ